MLRKFYLIIPLFPKLLKKFSKKSKISNITDAITAVLRNAEISADDTKQCKITHKSTETDGNVPNKSKFITLNPFEPLACKSREMDIADEENSTNSVQIPKSKIFLLSLIKMVQIGK